MSGGSAPALTIFLVAGEASGDQLGGRLMHALGHGASVPLRFRGVGGRFMQEAGLESLFPLEDIAVMGFVPVAARLRTLLARIRQTAEAVLAAPPDVLVLIDSPDFCRRVARQVRARRPDLPIVVYVSPTVWAWRPGRARAMRPLTDHLMALLPFEPAAHAALGGPATTYVGHPLMERPELFEASTAEGARRAGEPPLLLVLPGSRRSEVTRLLPPFGQVVAQVAAARPGCTFVLPAVPHLAEVIRAGVARWPVRPEIVTGEAEKWAAFRSARAALAASGTVTLELALAGVPMVVGYKLSWLEAAIGRRLIRVTTPVLPDLILGRHDIPVFMQEHCRPAAMTAALLPLLDGDARRAQLAQFEAMRQAMGTEEAPSAMAARIVLRTAREGRKRG